MVDEERMRPGHWLGLVLCVPFSALALTVGGQEEHLKAVYCYSRVPIQRYLHGRP